MPVTHFPSHPFPAIFDPPRARAQVQALAARSLVDRGYVIERIIPIDQFPSSAELALVRVFRRRSA